MKTGIGIKQYNSQEEYNAYHLAYYYLRKKRWKSPAADKVEPEQTS